MPLRPLAIAAFVLAVGVGAGRARADEEEHHLRQWVDQEGVIHLTLGPSEKARKRAQSLSLVPRATGQATKVRDTAAWDLHIAQAAQKYNVPQELVRAIIVAESNFRPEATSRVGARGLMQLMPNTAAAMFVNDLFDPVQNIYGGTRYLRILANQFDGDLTKTIAAYNAGPEAVRRASGIPSFAETQAYVRKVLKLYRIYKGVS
jgi:soluble lytic murein transglycosylase-like protein